MFLNERRTTSPKNQITSNRVQLRALQLRSVARVLPYTRHEWHNARACKGVCTYAYLLCIYAPSNSESPPPFLPLILRNPLPYVIYASLPACAIIHQSAYLNAGGRLAVVWAPNTRDRHVIGTIRAPFCRARAHKGVERMSGARARACVYVCVRVLVCVSVYMRALVFTCAQLVCQTCLRACLYNFFQHRLRMLVLVIPKFAIQLTCRVSRRQGKHGLLVQGSDSCE
jgi:hypothetical protein